MSQVQSQPARLGDRVGPPRGWQVGILVDAVTETPAARTLVLEVPGWPGHRAGQHVDLRLTADDGYTSERAYSIAAPLDPADPTRVPVTVQRVDDGEVSPYLVDSFPLGQLVELRGPVGGWFVWSPGMSGAAPVLLLAGGSGIVPVRAMLRARQVAGDRTPFRLLYSVRSPRDAIYLKELTDPALAADGVEVRVFYTRAAPDGSAERPRRMRLDDLSAFGWPASARPACYVCGPTGFVESAIQMLLTLGHDSASIRAERFGPSS